MEQNPAEELADKTILYLGNSVEDALMTFVEDGSTWQELIDLAKRVQDERQRELDLGEVK